MNLRVPLTMSLVLLAAMAAVSIWGWTVLPADVQIASHWGFDGRVNGVVSKDTGLVLLPAIGLGITLVLAPVPWIEPRRENIVASRKAFFALWLGALAVMAVTHAAVVLSAMGYALDVSGTILVAVALLIAVAGNYLGKVRPNFFIGIRTPWTLSSDLSWEKSHRMLGRLFVLSGLATLAARFAIGTQVGFVVLAAGLTASAVIGIASSYLYWRHDPERRTT